MSAQFQPKLIRTQAYLKALKNVFKLLTEVLIEFKKFLVIATLILFFILGVWHALKRIESREQPASPGFQRPP
jgi:hypothetical protein